MWGKLPYRKSLQYLPSGPNNVDSQVKSKGQTTFQETGTELWNSLNIDIRLTSDKIKYKNSVKKYLIQQMVEKEENIYVYYK